jgi:hypothetical protein
MKNKKNKKADADRLPGYPHYRESEDILSQALRVDADVEDLTGSPKYDRGSLNTKPPVNISPDSSPEIVPGTEADVTKEDLVALGPRDGDLDEGEDETLIPKVKIGPDLFGDDLDVPGAELDDEAEDVGSEDEENNYYSRGQD